MQMKRITCRFAPSLNSCVVIVTQQCLFEKMWHHYTVADPGGQFGATTPPNICDAPLNGAPLP